VNVPSFADFPNQAIANGNKAKRTDDFTHEWRFEQNKWFNPFDLVDDILAGAGLAVLSRQLALNKIAFQCRDPKVLNRIKYLYPRDKEPWRLHGFGRFLAALGIRMLNHIGVTEIDYMGRLWEGGAAIMAELGYKGGIRQKIEDYNYDAIDKFMRPFIQASHS